LHGALYAISLGIPAIHIATERKGYGAFQDLGLNDYLVPEKKFNSDYALSLAKRILGVDNQKYWDLVNKSYADRQAKKIELTDRMQSLISKVKP
jgi:polysaccharide pyruvyl transferase WcaK-like protein